MKYTTPYEYQENIPHFCINNPHMLPLEAYNFRSSAEYSNSFYSIQDNLELLRTQKIDNNKSFSFGFNDFLELFN